jgi:hypothetical protein
MKTLSKIGLHTNCLNDFHGWGVGILGARISFLNDRRQTHVVGPK